MGPDAAVDPPRRGLSLGWRLALYTSAIVTLVMGGVTFVQQVREIRNQQNAQEAMLRASLTPLVNRLEKATRLEDVSREIGAFHRAYIERGREAHHLVLRNSLGEVLVSTLSEPHDDIRNTIQAEVLLNSPALAGVTARLLIRENGTAFYASVSQQWRDWWHHMLVTVVSLLLFLQMAIRYLVTKPLERLLDGIRKMEMGYWEDLDIPGGAWEIRWLGWRFRNMGSELKNTVQHLLAAERRAMQSADAGASRAPAAVQEDTSLSPSGSHVPSAQGRIQRLRATADRLRAMSAGDPEALEIARRAWSYDRLEADRLGEMTLKATLEDAALYLLEPESFTKLNEQLASMTTSLAPWVEKTQRRLQQSLERAMVPTVSIYFRVKHTAGVWTKLRNKKLSLDQVHDLFAFRVVVPTETDCYWALGVLHRTFSPVLGRFKDYIASPKENGYQSIHTCLQTEEGPVFEVQIRSVAMHHQAERGAAAHWLYKADQRLSEAPRQGIIERLKDLFGFPPRSA